MEQSCGRRLGRTYTVGTVIPHSSLSTGFPRDAQFRALSKRRTEAELEKKVVELISTLL